VGRRNQKATGGMKFSGGRGKTEWLGLDMKGDACLTISKGFGDGVFPRENDGEGKRSKGGQCTHSSELERKERKGGVHLQK